MVVFLSLIFPSFPSNSLNIKSFDMGLRLIDNFENKFIR